MRDGWLGLCSIVSTNRSSFASTDRRRSSRSRKSLPLLARFHCGMTTAGTCWVSTRVAASRCLGPEFRDGAAQASGGAGNLVQLGRASRRNAITFGRRCLMGVVRSAAPKGRRNSGRVAPSSSAAFATMRASAITGRRGASQESSDPSICVVVARQCPAIRNGFDAERPPRMRSDFRTPCLLDAGRRHRSSGFPQARIMLNHEGGSIATFAGKRDVAFAAWRSLTQEVAGFPDTSLRRAAIRRRRRKGLSARRISRARAKWTTDAKRTSSKRVLQRRPPTGQDMASVGTS